MSFSNPGPDRVMIQIRHFLTDLAQIWYRGLILGANSKSGAILWDLMLKLVIFCNLH